MVEAWLDSEYLLCPFYPVCSHFQFTPDLSLFYWLWSGLFILRMHTVLLPHQVAVHEEDDTPFPRWGACGALWSHRPIRFLSDNPTEPETRPQNLWCNGIFPPRIVPKKKCIENFSELKTSTENRVMLVTYHTVHSIQWSNGIVSRHTRYQKAGKNTTYW